MILMGSSRDNFEATWVKNEWRRYLVLMNQGLKKTLIPAYFNMDPYHATETLNNHSSILKRIRNISSLFGFVPSVSRIILTVSAVIAES